MKLTGMERPVDVLGRVVIPREIRKRLQIEDGKDSFDIFFEDDAIILSNGVSAIVAPEVEEVTIASSALLRSMEVMDDERSFSG